MPTVREVIEGKEGYFRVASIITATPWELMVQLDDIGIDFREVTDFDVFCMLFNGISQADSSLVFEGMDFSGFRVMEDIESQCIVVRNEELDITIDWILHARICAGIRTILHAEKDMRKAANDEAAKYLIERNRIKQNRRVKRSQAANSQIEDYIVALVNCGLFFYDYNSVLDLTLYQFYASLKQVVTKTNYEHLAFGIYSGNVDAKKISEDSLNWLQPKTKTKP